MLDSVEFWPLIRKGESPPDEIVIRIRRFVKCDGCGKEDGVRFEERSIMTLSALESRDAAVPTGWHEDDRGEWLCPECWEDACRVWCDSHCSSREKPFSKHSGRHEIGDCGTKEYVCGKCWDEFYMDESHSAGHAKEITKEEVTK